jgi:hypothetical protein
MIERIGVYKLLWIISSITILIFFYSLDKIYDSEIKNGYDVTAKVVFKKCSFRRTTSIFVEYMAKEYEVVSKYKLCNQLKINDHIDLKYSKRKDKLFVSDHNPYQKYFRMSFAFFIASLFPYKRFRKIVYVHE